MPMPRVRHGCRAGVASRQFTGERGGHFAGQVIEVVMDHDLAFPSTEHPRCHDGAERNELRHRLVVTTDDDFLAGLLDLCNEL